MAKKKEPTPKLARLHFQVIDMAGTIVASSMVHITLVEFAHENKQYMINATLAPERYVVEKIPRWKARKR